MMRLLLLMLLSISNVHAEEFDAKVIVVMDGDTVLVLRDGKKIKVRLVNVDAPEAAQEFGRESRDALAGMVLKKHVQISSRAIDSYGRMIAELSVGGQSVNEAQVRSGMAWEYSHFHRNKRYQLLEMQAQQARHGLWAQAVQPVSPQQWRKSHPAKTPVAKPESVAHANVACGKKYLCRQMISCEEAKIYLLQCDVQTLDGNGDGVPCESLCVAEKSLQRPLKQGALHAW